MNKPKIDRCLLAYIRDDHDTLLVDLVEPTRNGHSYRYKGKIWNRDLRVFGGDWCLEQGGGKIRIRPLSRHYTPTWANESPISITEESIERYQLWSQKALRRANSFNDDVSD